MTTLLVFIHLSQLHTGWILLKLARRYEEKQQDTEVLIKYLKIEKTSAGTRQGDRIVGGYCGMNLKVGSSLVPTLLVEIEESASKNEWGAYIYR